MRFFVEPWAPEYGTPVESELAEPGTRLEHEHPLARSVRQRAGLHAQREDHLVVEKIRRLAGEQVAHGRAGDVDGGALLRVVEELPLAHECLPSGCWC